MSCSQVLKITGVAVLLLAGPLAAHGATLQSLDQLDLFGANPGDYTVNIAGHNFQGRVDHYGGHGWLLVGRGRQSWNFDADGPGGAIGDVNQNLGTPAAFTPTAYTDTLVNDLITHASTDMTGVEVRLRRAADPEGANYQEVRWRDFAGNSNVWTWDFDGSQYGVTVERVNAPPGLAGADVGTNTGGNTRDFLPNGHNDADRVFTWAWGGHDNQDGFSYGSAVANGANNATSFLWENGNENHAIPYTEVYVRLLNPDTPDTWHVGGEGNIGTDTLIGTQGNETYGAVIGAKYVRVVQNVNDSFQVAELQAFEAGTSLNRAEQSQGGEATAKDYSWDAPADRANDGITNGAFWDGSVWHSGSGLGTWLEIELAAGTPDTYDLETVHFWGRTDCCQDRQDNFNLIVEDASRNELFNQAIVGLGSAEHGSIQLGPLASADLTATLVDDLTYVFELGSNDQLTILNPDPGIFTTVLDVNNATIETRLLGTVSPGQVFKLLDVDSIIGTYDQLILPNTHIWDTSNLLLDGTLRFVAVPEPATLLVWSLLAGLGIGCGWWRRKKG